jgi:hypothetical protein
MRYSPLSQGGDHYGNNGGMLIQALVDYQRSDQFCEHPLQVRMIFQVVTIWMPDREASTPLVEINASFAKRLRDRAARERGYRFGNYALLMLQAVIKVAINSGTLSSNRVVQVPRLLPPRRQSTHRRNIRPIRHRISAQTDSGREESTG